MKIIPYASDISNNKKNEFEHTKIFIRYLKEKHLYNSYKLAFENYHKHSLTIEYFINHVSILESPFSSAFSFKDSEKIFNVPIAQFYVMENMFFYYCDCRINILKKINYV